MLVFLRDLDLVTRDVFVVLFVLVCQKLVFEQQLFVVALEFVNVFVHLYEL